MIWEVSSEFGKGQPTCWTVACCSACGRLCFSQVAAPTQQQHFLSLLQTLINLLLDVIRLCFAGGGSSSSSSGAATARSLLDGMRSVLDDSGDEGAEVEAAVLDAVGQLGLLRAGAELVLTDPDLAAAMLERALGRWVGGWA